MSSVLQIVSTVSGWLVELADYDRPLHFELYSTPPTGQRRRIVQAATTQHGIEPGVLITRDESRVIYMQGSTELRQWKLYSVPIAGGAATQLSQPMVAGGSVQHGFKEIDGGRIRFQADAAADETFRWFVVGIAGGEVHEVLFEDGFESGDTGAWT